MHCIIRCLMTLHRKGNAVSLSKPPRVSPVSEAFSGESKSVSQRPSSIGKVTYRENHQDNRLAFHNDSQVKPHFKALESFMNDDVLNLCGRNESRCGRRKISGGRSRGLNSKAPNDQERFLCPEAIRSFVVLQRMSHSWFHTGITSPENSIYHRCAHHYYRPWVVCINEITHFSCEGT